MPSHKGTPHKDGSSADKSHHTAASSSLSVSHSPRSIKFSNLFDSQLLAVIFVITFATVGAYLLFHSLAVSPYVSIEAESGTVTSPATIVSDSAVSGGKAIEFNAPSTPPTTPPTTPPPTTGSAPPPPAGYFNTGGPAPNGTAFPTDAQCAAQVNGSSWEPRPQNYTANHTVPPQPNTLANFTQWNATWNSTYKTRVDGNFTGTTDQIIQWVACKWGWPDNLIRAEAITESNWNQDTVSNGVPVYGEGYGDYEPRSNGHCVYDFTGDPCPTSYGMLQVKWYFHPTGAASNSPQSSYPWISKSTAFNLDLQVAEMRGCYAGMSTYMGNTTGDLWGCIQSWFSGAYTAGGGSYSQGVQSNENAKAWLTWPSS